MTRAGPQRRSAREIPITETGDTSAAPIIAPDNAPSPKCVRKSVSRVALPATCCATSEPEAIVAGHTAVIAPEDLPLPCIAAAKGINKVTAPPRAAKSAEQAGVPRYGAGLLRRKYG